MSFYFRQQVVSGAPGSFKKVSREQQRIYERIHAKTSETFKETFFFPENAKFQNNETLEEKIPNSFEVPHNSKFSVVSHKQSSGLFYVIKSRS